LLNLALSLVGKERSIEITEMIRRYAMMTPIAISPVASTIEPGFAPSVLTEKIIGQNTLKPIAFLALGLIAARAVALVSVEHHDESWTGSGFLVGPDLFLTNHHV